MYKNIQGKKVAILTEDGFEEIELTSPRKELEAAGAVVHIISPRSEKVKGWDHDHWSEELTVDVTLDKARPEDYDALMIPGGVMNPDKCVRIRNVWNLRNISSNKENRLLQYAMARNCW